MSARIPLSEPWLAGNEAEYLLECVRTNFVSSVGPFVDRFEQDFANFLGVPFAVACASGTAALHAALRASGVGAGDVVLVSDLTFIASVNAITYTGARAVLVDSERATWNLDTSLIRERLLALAARSEQLPRVIEPVHLLGHPVDLEPLIDVCLELGIEIIEDAAEALGGGYNRGSLAGKPVGTVGLAGCFSFNGNKVLTTGGGGMVVTHDEEFAARVRHLTTQAKVPGLGYIHDEVGFNYRLSNLAAAVGVAQLEQLSRFIEAKRELARRYDAAFEGLLGSIPPQTSWADRSSWLYSILAPTPEAARLLLDDLHSAGIDARPIWNPIHTHGPYRDLERWGHGVADDLAARGVSLPSSPNLAREAQNRVIEVVLSSLSRGRRGD